MALNPVQHFYFSIHFFGRIESAELDGSDRKVIISGIPHVFGIAVFGQYIYWTDWVTRSVKRAGKYNGGNTVTLMERLDAQPMDIKIFSRERQNCKNSNSLHILNISIPGLLILA